MDVVPFLSGPEKTAGMKMPQSHWLEFMIAVLCIRAAVNVACLVGHPSIILDSTRPCRLFST